MKPTSRLKLAEDKGPHERAMDRIEESWDKWRGPTGKPWTPYDGPTTPWSATVSDSLDKGRLIVRLESRVPLWRRILRQAIYLKAMLQGLIGKQ